MKLTKAKIPPLPPGYRFEKYACWYRIDRPDESTAARVFDRKQDGRPNPPLGIKLYDEDDRELNTLQFNSEEEQYAYIETLIGLGAL